MYYVTMRVSYSCRDSFGWICPEGRHRVVKDSWAQVKLLLLMNETEPPPIQPAFLVSLVVEPQMQENGLREMRNSAPASPDNKKMTVDFLHGLKQI